MNTLSKIKKKIIGRIMEEQMKEKKDRNENLQEEKKNSFLEPKYQDFFLKKKSHIQVIRVQELQNVGGH